MKNYYEILGVTENATKGEIKKGYFKMVRKFPPDRYEKEFMEIREAYETLSNEKTKEEYDSLLSIPGLIKVRFETAKELIKTNNIGKAIKILQEIESEHPEILIPRLLLGEAYLMNGNTGKAVKLYENLVEQEPENAAFRGHLANAYLHRNYNKKAISAFEIAIEMDEDNISLWLGLADTYMRTMDPYNADIIFKKALKVGAEKGWDLSIIYYKLIMKEIAVNNQDKVEEYLDKLVELIHDKDETDDNIPWKLAELGRNMTHYGMTEYAHLILDKVCILLPDDENLKTLKEDLAVFNNYAEMMDELAEDHRIPIEVEAIIAIKVLPSEVTDSMGDKESIELSNKMGICMNINIMKKGIEILKKEYPELYKVEKEFFQRLTGKKKIDKLKEELQIRAMKNPTIAMMMKAEIGNKGPGYYFDEEDDDFGFDFTEGVAADWIEPQEPYVKEEKKVGRNEPCPCGSGKKYKKCCGK